MPHKVLRYFKVSDAQQLSADAGAAISAGGAGWAWLGHANEILTFVATGVAIIAGIYAIAVHRKRLKDLDSK